MRLLRDGVLLRALVGEADHTDGRAVYRAIVDEAWAAGLAGATVFHGPLSFGSSRQENTELSFDAPRNPPVVVEIIDTKDRIEAFLPRLDRLIHSGFVTLEEVRMLRCGRDAASAAKRSAQ
jgi:uncharacterized protein